jgi:hypothetical protein
MRKLLLLVYVVLTAFNSSAQQYVLSGQITGKKNVPIPFASVYIKNSTYGSTANENGNYLFKLKPGTYDVIYLVVGYKKRTDKVTITNHNENHNVQLDDELFQLKEGNAYGNQKHDPATYIMRKVINKRKFYLNEVNSYSCVIYIKGVKKIISIPKTLLAKGMAKILELDTNGEGISYQSESLSAFSFKQPNKIKEEFIASKIAGINPPFNYNKASDLMVNFYKNMFFVDGLSSHGFVSPAGEYAFKYYKFKLLGTILDDGKRIDKIQVLSKHGKALSFSGNIYILEDEWRIYSVDLFLTKTFNNLNFVDTLKVSQQYIPAKNNTWQPLSFQYSYAGSVQGLKFSGYYLGVNNNYKIDTAFEKGYFTHEILHVDTGANMKSYSFWTNTRPVPLSIQEEKNYNRKDSIAALQRSKRYLDSIQHNNNKIALLPYALSGNLATYKNNKDSLYLYPLLQTIYYNTVEGWGIYLRGRYSKNYTDNRSLSISPGIRYGFSDKQFNANMHAVYTYDQEHAGKFFLDFGSDLLDLNNLGTRSLLFNTLSTLLSEQNFTKYYRSQFGDFGYQREITNGLLWMANISYANRTQLYNTSYDHIVTYSDKRYTSNNPLAPNASADDRSELFPQNQALIFNTSVRFTFDQQYITRPTGKIYLPSLYPVITLNYRKGINNILSSDVNYDFLSLDISQDRIQMGLFGHSAFEVKAGGFLNEKSVYFMDYNHFIGNQGTTFDPTYVGSFHFLPFYTYSTDNPFLEAHYQHNFSGAILDNIPFLRELKLEEIIGVNYLTEKNNPNYSEFYVGLKRLMFGVDYGVAYQGSKKYLQGFRIFYGLR